MDNTQPTDETTWNTGGDQPPVRPCLSCDEVRAIHPETGLCPDCHESEAPTIVCDGGTETVTVPRLGGTDRRMHANEECPRLQDDGSYQTWARETAESWGFDACEYCLDESSNPSKRGSQPSTPTLGGEVR